MVAKLGDKKKEKEKKDSETEELLSMLSVAADRPEMRALALYGDVNEEKCVEVVYALLSLDFSTNATVKMNSEDNTIESFVADPIDFYISTYGGQATEMFSVYDTMRMIRERSPIHTHGLGKVMSAGVLLLAAGTKGERRIGKHCRVMIHGVVAGQHGHIADIENEFSETKMTQSMYIDALTEETDMTRRHIKKLMEKKTNVYLNAEEAVNLGIADIIV